jgi:hypothetical protein
MVPPGEARLTFPSPALPARQVTALTQWWQRVQRPLVVERHVLVRKLVERAGVDLALDRKYDPDPDVSEAGTRA